MLGENCFPTFFNSVHCNQQETGCIFDNFSDRAHGLCQSETLALRVLRNRGDAECEDWVIEQIEVRDHIIGERVSFYARNTCPSLFLGNFRHFKKAGGGYVPRFEGAREIG
ncbi:unnamed protein product [Heligmosomoides polygyrus]|uniref:Phlebovirus glycoprotein G2 fusion domain-containing protein n=1 Tax=Heligmosomoides polygyrus TaxID=6339 RepID=A0A183GBW0_HELPZ|nr:unnamed protein product [Heligmosomoides polygyrus]